MNIEKKNWQFCCQTYETVCEQSYSFASWCGSPRGRALGTYTLSSPLIHHWV